MANADISMIMTMIKCVAGLEIETGMSSIHHGKILMETLCIQTIMIIGQMAVLTDMLITGTFFSQLIIQKLSIIKLMLLTQVIDYGGSLCF